MQRKILIMGLPGAGKTTLANALAPLLNAVVFNADAVRANLSRDLGFSHEDRVEHARRMGWMCDRVVESRGLTCYRGFHLPDPANAHAVRRGLHRSGLTVLRPVVSRTLTRMFVAPEHCDLTGQCARHAAILGRAGRWARLRPAFDPQRTDGSCSSGAISRFTAVTGRLIEEGLRRVGQVCIAVRDTHGIDAKNPLPQRRCHRPDRFRLRVECARAAVPDWSGLRHGRAGWGARI